MRLCLSFYVDLKSGFQFNRAMVVPYCDLLKPAFYKCFILPLFAFDFTKWDQVVLFLVFFVTLGFLCIRHNHFSVNILLEILNYKMYTCELEDEDKNVVQRKIISHRTLNTHKGEYIYLKSLNNEIKLDIEN